MVLFVAGVFSREGSFTPGKPQEDQYHQN